MVGYEVHVKQSVMPSLIRALLRLIVGRPPTAAVEFSSAETGRYRPYVGERLADGVGFSAMMDRSPRELGKGLKDDDDEGPLVVSSVTCTPLL